MLQPEERDDAPEMAGQNSAPTLFMRLKVRFSDYSRRKRMRRLVELMFLEKEMTVLDLGGTPVIWQALRTPLKITILNLPGRTHRGTESHHAIRYVEGDACKVVGFAGKTFDLVFSNSVIEHVGPANKQAEFAREVRRLGKSYWVQTPSKWFPIEPHCNMPFWWFYPVGLRRYLIDRWRRRLPAWTEMVEETRVLTRADMRRLFPEATILVERVLGIPKSYVAYFSP